jgi:hypothetical protein
MSISPGVRDLINVLCLIRWQKIMNSFTKSVKSPMAMSVTAVFVILLTGSSLFSPSTVDAQQTRTNVLGSRFSPQTLAAIQQAEADRVAKQKVQQQQARDASASARTTAVVVPDGGEPLESREAQDDGAGSPAVRGSTLADIASRRRQQNSARNENNADGGGEGGEEGRVPPRRPSSPQRVSFPTTLPEIKQVRVFWGRQMDFERPLRAMQGSESPKSL